MRLNLRDSIHTFIGSGLVTPLLLLTVVFVNLSTGWAWIPPYTRYYRLRGDWVSAPDPHFWAAVLLKASVAVMCLGWYGLGNVHPLDRLARPVTALGALMLVAAIVCVLLKLVQL